MQYKVKQSFLHSSSCSYSVSLFTVLHIFRTTMASFTFQTLAIVSVLSLNLGIYDFEKGKQNLQHGYLLGVHEGCNKTCRKVNL